MNGNDSIRFQIISTYGISIIEIKHGIKKRRETGLQER